MSQKIIQKFKIGEAEIIFRYPEIVDSPSILKLVSSLFEERAMVGVNEKPTMKGIKNSLEKKMKGIKNKEIVYFVVDLNGEVEGRAWINKEESPKERVGSLVIHLARSLRGKGVGDKLLKAILKEAKKVLKIKIVTLEVMAENVPAINLYKKNGFVMNGMLTGGLTYYKRHVDDILMVKYL